MSSWHSYRTWLIAVVCSITSMSLLAQEATAPKSAAQPGAGMEGGYGGMGGGYGGDMGGGYGAGMAMPPLKFMIVEGENEAGNERMKVRTASRVKQFAYALTSLKPIETNNGYGGMGMYGGGGYGGYGGGMMGDGGYGGDMMGGDMMGGYGGDMMGGYGGGMMGGPGAPPATPRLPIISIYAYVFDKDQENNRTRIELLTNLPPSATQKQRQVENMSGFGAEGSGMGPGGAAGMGPGGAAGMPMGAPGAGMANIQRFVRLASLVGPPQGPKDKHHLTQAEYTIVANTIKQKIWKADAVKQLNAEQGNAAETEQLLKQLLTEEYETQLSRQEMEVESIQQRIAQLKEEINRRRSAKERVIDVQLGRIVLEAQGLLGK